MRGIQSSVCWPWFGPHPTEPSFPSHGFARTSPWEVTQTRSLSNADVRLSLRLAQSDAVRPLWPHLSRLDVHISVGTVLTIELVTQNIGPSPITLGEALHAYFQVADVRQVAIDGLEGCHYVDKVDRGQRKTQLGPVKLEAETDRVYRDTTADCLIHDPSLKRRIRISKRGSRSTVIWNPWAEKAAQLGDMGQDGYLNMVCVESGNAADNVVTVAPGQKHHLWTRYQVESRG
jgi:glucose-6-phosphate 1-epimerase